MSDSSEALPGNDAPDARIGTLLGERYRLDTLIGEGGMGKIYAAEHVLMHKKVAVKVLHRSLVAMPDVVSRFKREAMAAGNIDNPHVASATDFGTTPDGAVFLVLEFIDGTGLRDVMDQGPLPTGRALHIARQIALALASAHALKIVHRDLKPENVMLVQKGNDPDFVKVLDFGIARVPFPSSTDREPRRASEGPITRAGTVFGTPEYMAPEQALGQPVDGRADLYALGVILFEMLAGVRPFVAGTQTGLLGQQLAAPPPRFATRAPSIVVTQELEALVHRLLAREVEDRFASAGDVIDALSTILGVPVPPSSHVTPPPSTVADRLMALSQTHDTELSSPSFRSEHPPPEPVQPNHSSAASFFERLRTVSRFAPWIAGLLVLLGVGAVIRRLDGREGVAPIASAEGSRVAQPLGAPKGQIATDNDGAKSEPFERPPASERGAPPAVLPTERRALEKLLAEQPRHVEAAIALARVGVEDRAYEEAAELVARALKLDAGRAVDPRIASILFQTVQAQAARELSFALLEGPMGARGADILYDLAVDNRVHPSVRRRAERFLESKVFRAVATPALSIAVALRAAQSCRDKLALLTRATSVADRRSLRYLEGYLERTGCGPRGNQDCSSCLRQSSALDDAIDAVKGRD